MERSQTVSRVTLAVTYVGAGLVWLAVVLYVILGNIILRETPIGKLAQEVDRLPMFVAKPFFIASWFLFLLGWLAPLSAGFRVLLRGRKAKVSN